MDSRSAVRLTGAVYTPPDIAAAVVSVVKDILPSRSLNILEPSVGDGAFLNEMMGLLKGHQFTAVDIDKAAIKQLKRRLADGATSVSFKTSDFVSYASTYISAGSRPFDLIIGNPPFIRKHNFSEEFKDSLESFAAVTGYPLKHLKNSWAAFLLASSRIVSEGGIVAFIVPYELMTVEYGQRILQTLLAEFERIDIFVSKNKAFPAIDQDAVIFIGEKKRPHNKGLYINCVEHMSDLSAPKVHKLALGDQAGQALELNAFLLPSATVDLLRTLRASCPSIQDYAGSAPGIVSAANEFFILRKSDVKKLAIKKHVIPILKKGSLASYKPIFTADDFSDLEAGEPCYLLRIKGDFETLDQNLQAYIKEGEKKGFHLRFKCRNRKNWYEVPIVPRELGFFFKRSHEFPRVCLNEANVYLTDTAYGLRVRDGFTMKGLCYSFYNSLTLLFAETNGRFYGGGVLELSPTEFRGLPLVYHEPTEAEFAKFVDVHSSAKGNVDQILDFGDQWLREKLGLSKKKMAMIRQAWLLVRAHRMRHGGRVSASLEVIS